MPRRPTTPRPCRRSAHSYVADRSAARAWSTAASAARSTVSRSSRGPSIDRLMQPKDGSTTTADGMRSTKPPSTLRLDDAPTTLQPYGTSRMVIAMPRNRSAAVDASIADAAIGLLREVGYAKLTMGEVARRAGVGKDSLYRRFSSKAALVHETVFGRYPSGYRDAPATGSLLGDVEALATMLQEANTTPEAAAAIRGTARRARAGPGVRKPAA